MENINHLLTNPAVIWFLIGLVMLVFEFFIPGLIILFFGIGSWMASIGVLIMPDMPLNVQLAIFLFSSILSLIFLRNSLKKWLGHSEKDDGSKIEEFVGHQCIADSNFENGEGTVIFKGAVWKALSNIKIKKGDAVIIKSIDSIRLNVEPI